MRHAVLTNKLVRIAWAKYALISKEEAEHFLALLGTPVLRNALKNSLNGLLRRASGREQTG